ncbi:MAG: PQQ-binding-like beta-propeller repeat protein [Pirellulales bacterium]
MLFLRKRDFARIRPLGVTILQRTMIVAAVLFAATGLAQADEWPQWRGPTRDGVWKEDGLLESFPAERIEDGKLRRRWRAEVGSGYNGPTVAAGRVFVMDRQVKPKQTERVLAFAAATGEPLWTFEYDCIYENISYEAGPRAAVSLADGLAYALGTMGHLHCLSAATGELVWKKDLLAEYKIRMPIWGIAAAPLVDGERVIVQVGGEKACLVAFDRRTGKEVWRALDERASYSAPIIIQQAGKRVLVCWTGDSVSGLNPADGSVYWSHPFKPTRMVINIATPVTDGDRLFMTSFYDGSLMLKLRQDKPAVEQVWRRLGPDEKTTDALHSIISTPYLSSDHVYGVDSYGELRCLDAATGDRIWEDRTVTPRERWSNIHMVKNGDRMWMFNEAGELVIGRLSPKKFEEISRAKLIDPTRVQLNRRQGVCWSHPAYAYKHVFARSDDELVCANLAADEKAEVPPPGK